MHNEEDTLESVDGSGAVAAGDRPGGLQSRCKQVGRDLDVPGLPGGAGATPVYVGTAQFLANGTLSGSPTDQHSGPTIGQWSRTGNYEFAFTFVADTFDSSGAFANTHRVRGTLTLSDDGLSATGKIVLEILDTTGKVIFTAPFPTTFTGARLVVLPL
jgi:hypothetical protein